MSDPASEENILDPCRPLSPDKDGLESGSSDEPSPGVLEVSTEGQSNGGDPTKEISTFPNGRQEPSKTATALVNEHTDTEPQYKSEYINT